MKAQVETHEFLTVPELAELLRIKERKVYDLASSGDVPCSRATGKLLFPAREVRAWLKQAETGNRDRATRPSIILGSHDPLLEWAIRQSRCGLPTFFDGSFNGVEGFSAGEGIAAGLHAYDVDTDTWNLPLVRKAAADQNAVLIAFARRQRGLICRDTHGGLNGLSDLGGTIVVPRQAGSGTEALFTALAARDGLHPDAITHSDVARTEDDAAQMVLNGEADVAFGLEYVARTFGLTFVPIIEERFDLLVDRKAWFDEPLQTLFGFFGTEAFLTRAARHGGYDTSGLGAVVWNG